MKVVDRRGRDVDVCFSHIRARLEEVAARRPLGAKQFDVDAMALDVFAGLRDGMSTADIDRLAVSVCTECGHKGLADVLAASDLHRRLFYWMPQAHADEGPSALDNRRPPPFSQRVSYLWKASEGVSDHFCKFVVEHAAALDAIPDYDLDLEFGHEDVDALLAQKCLWLFGGAVAETPQDMFVRAATAVHLDFKRPAEALKRIRELYDLLASRKVELDACILRNAGGPRESLASHIAMEIAPGGLPSVYKGLTDLAQILSTGSSAAVNLNAVPVGSVAAVARLVLATAEYAGAAAGKVAVVLSAWHGDIARFLTLDAPALKRCVLVPDVLVEAASDGVDGPWMLFDPRDAPELVVTWGKTFDAKYAQAIEAKRHLRVVKAAEVVRSCVDDEDVRVVYVDRATEASAHRNVGGLRGGSCYCDSQAYNATVTAHVRMDRIDGPGDLRGVARTLVRSLDRALEVACHPTKEVYDAVRALRCIGVGVRGVAGDPATDAEALQFACLDASMRLVKEEGLPAFHCFTTSPYSGGQRRPRTRGGKESSRLDWSRLLADIRKHGLRNSTVTMRAGDAAAAYSEAAAAYFDQVML